MDEVIWRRLEIDDTWGVLGPTACPFCHNAAKSKLLAALFVVAFLYGVREGW